MSDHLICLGVITGPHGVRGQVKIKTFTDEPAGLTAYGPLYSEDGAREFTLKITGEAKGQLIATLTGVKDRNEAERLKGAELCVPRDMLPATEDEDEFYYEELVGMDVLLESGEVFGQVKQVHNHGAGDMLEIALKDGSREFYSFSKANFPVIDAQARTITFRPPEEVEAAR